MLNLLYVGISNNPHDKRFVEALENIGQVHKIFTDYPIFEQFQFTDFDAVISGPLSITLDKFGDLGTTKLIGMCHAFEINEIQIPSREFDQVSRNIARCTRIICDSENSKTRLREVFGYQAPIYVIPYGCNLSSFSPTKAINEPNLHLLSMRNWTNLHSNHTIIEAIELLDGMNILESVVFIGDGPELAPSIKRINELNLKTKIEFKGFVSESEILNSINNANVYVSASRSDGISVSLMEAMAGGLLPCTSDFASNLEIIDYGKNGFYFANGDAQSLKSILISISNLTIEERKGIAMAARGTAEKKFNWESNKRDFLRAILEVVA